MVEKIDSVMYVSDYLPTADRVVLRLALMGKTPSDIAEILGLEDRYRAKWFLNRAKRYVSAGVSDFDAFRRVARGCLPFRREDVLILQMYLLCGMSCEMIARKMRGTRNAIKKKLKWLEDVSRERDLGVHNLITLFKHRVVGRALRRRKGCHAHSI